MLPFSDDLRTRQINRPALARARAVLGENVTASDNVASQSQALTDVRLRELLKQIEENTRRGAEKPQIPLAAPPPAPAGRM
jgi:hypothetical protein